MKPSELTERQLSDLLEEGSGSFALEYESTGPGKFEGEHNPGLTQRVYEASLEGWNDDQTGSVDWGLHVSLLGRFLLLEDSHGFVALHEFDSTEAAESEFSIAERDYGEWDDEEA